MDSNIYIHTLHGRPAAFDGNQVCFVCGRQQRFATAAANINQIKREQRASIRYRRKQGLPEEAPSIYGFVRFKRPNKESK